jgi:hypothetical protein
VLDKRKSDSSYSRFFFLFLNSFQMNWTTEQNLMETPPNGDMKLFFIYFSLACSYSPTWMFLSKQILLILDNPCRHFFPSFGH